MLKYKFYSRSYASPGFTLIELGVVLIILSLMTSALLSIVNQNMRLEKEAVLKERMGRIESALLSYRNAYGYLPCPADITLAEDAANFGVQAANAGACTGGIPTAGWNDHAFSSICYSVGGAIPVATLGLPEDYAYDPWNGRFLYFVDYRATSADGFAKLASGVSTATISVSAFSGGITTSAVLVVASMGPNGNGAYTNAGGTPKNMGSNTQEIVNNRGLEQPPGNTPGQCAGFYTHRRTLNAGAVNDEFDDSVRFYQVGFFSSNSDKTIENQ